MSGLRTSVGHVWHLGVKELRIMQLFMISAFYITSWVRRPKRAFKFFKGQITGSEDTYLDQMVRTKRKNLALRKGEAATEAAARRRPEEKAGTAAPERPAEPVLAPTS